MPEAKGPLKLCPDCAEQVAAAARVCRFCGYRFAPREEEPAGAMAAQPAPPPPPPPPPPAATTAPATAPYPPTPHAQAFGPPRPAVPSAQPLNWEWALVPPLSLGFLAPVPLFYAGARARHRPWILMGAIYLVLAVAVVALMATGSDHDDAVSSVGGALLIVLMGAPAVNILAIRKSYGQRVAALQTPELQSAEQRLLVRDHARRIARSDPERARELGVGRPDLPGAFDGGLVDVNHAPERVLVESLGLSEAVAAQIVETRSAGTGFSSSEDLDLAFDLPREVLAEVRERGVFLPI